LERGEVVLCDRFYDYTIAYQGFGRGLEMTQVRSNIDFAVGDTRPDLTLLLHVPLSVSEARRQAREAGAAPVRDRIESAGREFFERVERGFQVLAQAEPRRVQQIDATAPREEVSAAIWKAVQPLLSS
jgi:dTMP kinase